MMTYPEDAQMGIFNTEPYMTVFRSHDGTFIMVADHSRIIWTPLIYYIMKRYIGTLQL